MLRRLFPLTVLTTMLFARVAGSTTVIPPSFDELVSTARSIFVGEVIDLRAVWDTSPRGRSIVTLVTFRVESTWKGSVGPVTQLEFLGGTIDDLTMDVSGVPRFVVGQRDVLFVASTARSVSPLVGFMHGRLRLLRDPALGVDRVSSYDGRALGGTAEIGARRTPSLLSVTPMRLSELEAAVRARLSAARVR